MVVQLARGRKMAKKKPAPKSKTEEKPAKARSATKKKAVKKVDVVERSCSSDDIGQVAGEIWHRLDSDGHQSIAQLKKSISAPSDIVMAAVGWLAREDKVAFEKNGRSTKVGLR